MLRTVLLFPLTRLILAAAFFAAAFIVRDAINETVLHLDNQLWRALVTIVVIHAGYVLYVRLIEQRSVVELAPKVAAKELGTGLVIGMGLIALVVGLLWLLGNYQLDGVHGWQELTIPLLFVAATAYTEELIIRGVVFRLMEEGLGTWIALALTAGLFGMLHLGNENATLFGAFAIAATGGVLLAATFVFTRRLWLAVGIHFAVNWSQGALFGLPVSGHDASGFLDGRLQGPALLTGGSFGVEASLLLVIAGTGLAVAVTLCAYRAGHFVAPLWHRREALRKGGIFLKEPSEPASSTPPAAV